MLMPATDEELALIASYQANPNSRTGDRILRRYDRWCSGTARRVSLRFGLPFDEAMQAARLGLIDAAGKFEPERGFGLLTYADARVRRHVADARGEAFGSPGTYVLESRRHIRHARRTLRAEGKSTTDESVAAHLGWGVERVTAAVRRTISMDAPLADDGDGDGGTMHDVLASPARLRPDHIVQDKLQTKALRVALECAIVTSLSERNAEIVQAFLDADCDLGAQSTIATKLGVSRQRVSLAINQSMPKLARALRLNGWGAHRAREMG